MSLADASVGRLLLHCKKSGCDFRDILCAAGIAPGHFEIDLVAQQQAERARKDQAEKLKARARSAWSNAGPIAGTRYWDAEGNDLGVWGKSQKIRPMLLQPDGTLRDLNALERALLERTHGGNGI